MIPKRHHTVEQQSPQFTVGNISEEMYHTIGSFQGQILAILAVLIP